MAGAQVLPPFPVFTDVDGDSLDDGYIFVGIENQDPIASPVSVFWDQALTIPAVQPIRTIGGYPSNGGVRARFYSSASAYSILVRNKNSTAVYTTPSSISSNLESRLADATNPSLGAAMLGRGTVAIASIKDLLSSKRDVSQELIVAAYHPGVYALASPDVMGGSGRWIWSPNVPKASHNGGTIISPTVPWDGTQPTLAAFLAGTGETAPGTNGCFVMSATGPISVKNFGAKGDNATNDTVPIQKCINAAILAGRPVYLSSGIYQTTSTLTIDNSASVSYLDTKKVDFYGDGIQSSRIVYLGASGSALSVLAGSGAGTLPGISMQKLSGFTLIGTNAASTIGLALDTTSEITISNVQLNSFDLGMDLLDVDFATFDSMMIQFNARGVFGKERFPRAANSTRPNSISFNQCKIGGNGLFGAHFQGGSCINFNGGHVEGNGQNNGASGWGVKAEGCGVQGGIGLNMNGVYCEANQGVADIWIVAVDPPLAGLNPYHCVHVIHACDMHRVGNTQFTTNNVRVSINSANAGKQKVIIRGSAFKGFGSYVPNAGRPYVAYDVDPRNSANCLIEGCIQQDDIESVPQNDYYNVSLGLTAPQAMTTAVSTTVLWTNEFFDSDGMHAPGTGIVTIPVSGKYLVSGMLYWAASAVGVRSCTLFKNGATEVGGDTRNASTTGRVRQSFTVELLLNKGDTLEIKGFQDSGVLLNTDSDGAHLSVRSMPF